MENKDYILETKNLSIGYADVEIAANINLSLPKNSFLCITGQNGSGKSTFVKTLFGFVPVINGTLTKNFEMRDVGYLPQLSEINLSFPASVEEVVLSGCLDKPSKFFYSKKDKTLAEENMKKLEIFDLKNKSFKVLSGGQKQRVLIARALCASKNIIILDEPTNGLDVSLQKKLYDLLLDLFHSGLTIIMVSHDLDNVKNYATHILDFSDTVNFIENKG